MKWSDLPWLLLFLGAGAGFAWLLYQHWNGPLSSGSREPVGTIVEKTLTVQRQLSDSTLWRPMQNGTDVFAFDKIRTTQGSQATIILNEGTQFTLQEQSLIVLSWEEGRPALIVDEGMLRVSSQTQMEVRLGDKIVVIPEGTAQLARSQGDIKITPESGTVRVRTELEEVEYTPDTQVAIRNDIVNVEENPWNFFQPRPNEVFYLFKDTGTLTFQGIPLNDFSVMESYLESPSRQKLALTAQGTAQVFPGVWKWVIILQKEDVQKEVSATFQIESLASPVPLSPPNQSEFRYVSAVPPVLLAWTSADEATQFRVLISRNPDLSDPVLARMVNAQAFTAVGLGEGAWYWGIVPVMPERVIDQPVPVVHRFSLNPVSRSFSPRLLRPIPEERFSEKDLSEAGITFQWQIPVEGVSTEVVLYADPEKTRVAARALGTAAVTLVADLPPGTYPFTLRTVFGPGDFSNASEGTLTIRERSALPVWISPESKTRQPWISNSAVSFRWDKGGSYQVVL